MKHSKFAVKSSVWSSMSYITRDVLYYGPLSLWIITNWKQYWWGQRVKTGLLYFFHSVRPLASKPPPSFYHLSIPCTHTQMTHISDSMGVICPLGSECLEKTIKLENFYYSVKRIALNRVLLNCALKRSER